MTENLENKETVNNAEVEVKADEPKTYTQAEVDKIVQGVRHKDKKKYQAKIDELNADLKYSDAQLADARLIQGVLNEGGGITGSFSEIAQKLASQYELTDDNVSKLKNKATNDGREAQKNDAFVTAQRKMTELSIEELAEVVEEIEKKSVAEQTLEERALYRQAKTKVDEFKVKQKEEQKNNFDTDKAWLENEVEGADFDKLIRSNEFADFINTTGMEVRKGLQAFVKLNKTTIAEKFAKEATTHPSTGSVKDNGTSKLKEFYSPEDVDNLSSKDLDDPEIFERVRKSMAKWK